MPGVTCVICSAQAFHTSNRNQNNSYSFDPQVFLKGASDHGGFVTKNKRLYRSLNAQARGIQGNRYQNKGGAQRHSGRPFTLYQQLHQPRPHPGGPV